MLRNERFVFDLILRHVASWPPGEKIHYTCLHFWIRSRWGFHSLGSDGLKLVYLNRLRILNVPKIDLLLLVLIIRHVASCPPGERILYTCLHFWGRSRRGFHSLGSDRLKLMYFNRFWIPNAPKLMFLIGFHYSSRCIVSTKGKSSTPAYTFGVGRGGDFTPWGRID